MLCGGVAACHMYGVSTVCTVRITYKDVFFTESIPQYRVRQRIRRFLSVKKNLNIGYYDTVTFIRKYIL